MIVLRRFAYPVWLVATRLSQRKERLALVGVGVLAGSAVLAAVLAGSLVMRDRALARATEQIPVGHRSVQVGWFGSSGIGTGDWRSLDRTVGPALHRLGGRPPVAVMLFREAQIRGHLVDLRAVDGLGRWVRLRSGRLPRPCAPTSRCEVIRILGTGPVPSTPGLRLVQVGTATLLPDAPFAAFIKRAEDGSVVREAVAYHVPPQPPMLVAEGVRGLSQTPELATFFRSYAWMVPIGPGDVHPWAIDGFADGVARVRSEVTTRSDAFDVVAPTEELRAAASAGRASARRLLLLGGEAATLLLAFTILAAASLRRDVDAAWRRLSWFGASRWQLVLFSLTESAVVAAAGTLAGWAAGGAIGAVVAREAGSPAGEILTHSLASTGGLAAGLALAAAATILLFGALRSPALQLAGLSLSAIDVAALGALGAIVIGLTRGNADAAELAAGGGTGGFLILLPALIAFVAAVVATRLLVPLLRAAGRMGRRGSVALRLATLSLARNPGHAAIAATFLVVSLGMALFAQTYRSTLARGQAEQAAFAVPADIVVREDLTQLVSVPQAAPLAAYRRLGRGVDPVPVLRAQGDAGRLETSGGVTLLGIPAAALPGIDGWRSDFSATPLAQLARRVAPEQPVSLRGVRLPRDASALELGVRVRGDDIGLRAIVESPIGVFDVVELGETSDRGVLRARLPRHLAGGRLVSLQLDQLGGRLTANAGTGLQPVSEGTLTLGPLRVETAAGARDVAVDWSSWVGRAAEITSAGGTAEVRFQLTTEVTGELRPRQPTDGQPVPAVVSPTLAAAADADRLLPLRVAGVPITVRVTGTLERFPSVTEGDVVVADRSVLSTVLDTASAGLGVTNEIWLRGIRDDDESRVESALARPPFDALEHVSQRRVRAELRGDPLAHGALLTLAATALTALLLAVVGLVLAVVSDLRDESGELRDLETQGATPALLRRHLRLRSLVVAAFGLAGGIVTGAVLGALVLDLVTLTANAGAPQPPLRLVIDWPLVLAGAVSYAALAAALVAALTWNAFRREAVGRVMEAPG
jgi:FtsX-like permease family protein